MTDGLKIRPSSQNDLSAIHDLYCDAFPNENLLPLVQDLLNLSDEVLSLVCENASTLTAHILFTKCRIDGMEATAALLGPLAVATPLQRMGLGTQLIRNGLHRLKDDLIEYVFVLGDPAYYQRFGFTAENNVAPPYTLPFEWKGAWQSLSLGDAGPLRSGTIRLPIPWMSEELWRP